MSVNLDPGIIESLRERIELKKAELDASPAQPGLVPIQIACSMASCGNGRHCLNYLTRPRRGDAPTPPGCCRDCGQRVVSLPEVNGRSYSDPSEMVNTCIDQQRELIRAHYWHVPIDRWAYNQGRRLGMDEVHRRIRTRVTQAMLMTNFNGRGAPYTKDILAYAQHATATCCRKCAAYWHGLPRDPDVVPSEEQLEYVVDAAIAYLELRLPNLAREPEAHVEKLVPSMWLNQATANETDSAVAACIVDGQDPTGLLVSTQSRLRLVGMRSSLAVSEMLDFKETA